MVESGTNRPGTIPQQTHSIKSNLVVARVLTSKIRSVCTRFRSEYTKATPLGQQFWTFLQIISGHPQTRTSKHCGRYECKVDFQRNETVKVGLMNFFCPVPKERRRFLARKRNIKFVYKETLGMVSEENIHRPFTF